MALKSIHLASTHRAFDVRVFKRECVTLVEAGYDVSLIVPHPADELVDGVRIKAVPPPRSGGQRLTKTLWKIFRAALREDKVAVFHVHDAELLPYALVLALLGRKVIYDAHEDTPRQVMTQHWIPPAIRPTVSVFYEFLEAAAARLCTHIFAAWPGIRDRYPPEKVTLLRNYPQKEEFAGVDLANYTTRENVLVYAGGITEVRGIFELLELMTMLPANLDVRFALAGAFYPSDLEARARAHPGWQHVDYYDWLDRDELAALMARSRIGYCVLQPTPQHLINYPNKVFEYMAAGLPVVASGFPVWREIISKADCGVLVDPSDLDDVARAVAALLEDSDAAERFGRNGREEFLARRNWEMESERLLRVYRRIEEENRPGSSATE